MKIRIISMALALALVLSGCGQDSTFLAFWQNVFALGPATQDTRPDVTPPSATPTSPSSPTETEPSATHQPTDPPTEPPTDPTEPSDAPTEPPTEPPTDPTEPPTEPTPTDPPMQVPEILAEYAFVYSCNTRSLLYTKGDQTTRTAPASLTKLFTCYVALIYLDVDAVVTIGEEVTWIAMDSSLVWLKQGQQLTVETLIAAMMLRSGNDAAYALAVAAGREISQDPDMSARDALNRFIDEMNSQAAFYGLTGSHFVNPDGYTADDHYTTPADMLTIARLALLQPAITRYTCLQAVSGKFISGESYSWGNTNHLVQPESDYYCPAAIGLKTGYTEVAGQCVIAAFEVGDDILIVGVMKSKSVETRFEDALALYNCFANT